MTVRSTADCASHCYCRKWILCEKMLSARAPSSSEEAGGGCVLLGLFMCNELHYAHGRARGTSRSWAVSPHEEASDGTRGVPAESEGEGRTGAGGTGAARQVGGGKKSVKHAKLERRVCPRTSCAPSCQHAAFGWSRWRAKGATETSSPSSDWSRYCRRESPIDTEGVHVCRACFPSMMAVYGGRVHWTRLVSLMRPCGERAMAWWSSSPAERHS